MVLLTEKNNNRTVLDTEPAHIRKTGGVTVQRIPAKWTKLQWLKNFFDGDLEIKLIQEAGEPLIEIRRAHKP